MFICAELTNIHFRNCYVHSVFIFSELYQLKASVKVQNRNGLPKCFLTEDTNISWNWGSPGEMFSTWVCLRSTPTVVGWVDRRVDLHGRIHRPTLLPGRWDDRHRVQYCDCHKRDMDLEVPLWKEYMDTCRVNCTFVQVRYNTPENGSSRIGELSYGEHDLNEKVCKRD